MDINEIRRHVMEGKAVIGTNKTLKLLKLGQLSAVVLAKNVPDYIKEDIEYYAKLSNIPVIQVDLFNDELGAALKKRFKVSVVGILK
ncbi:NEQ179 [Nanoarchaeum equitans Kin4-M]|uniref:NEQ179 n=1 Tax=Nanoarchaeum equitans (strain Kin4-M) TaxID=228908 RepID=Q74MP1_NANEQ|nr:NEQ179 [Nanoarchaeum equitans Kin4-M]